LPEPPSSVSVVLPAGSVAAESVSLPAPAATISASVDSDPLMVIASGRPVTVSEPPWHCTAMTSSYLVAFKVTVSAAPSPTPLPGGDARSMATCVTPVPERSLTVMLSALPKALSWMCSTPLRSMVTLPTSRTRLTRP